MSESKYKSLGDSELVTRCLEGEGEAWAALISRYRRLIYSIPFRFGLGTADANDVFQSVCVKLIEHLNDLKDESKVSSWLITITNRQCIALRSSLSRESSTDDLVAEPASSEQSLEDIQIQTQRSQIVREAVEELPDRCRQLFQMLYLDQHTKSYEEIARILEIPVPSIGPTRARCLDRLRTLLRRRKLSEG